MGLDLYIANWNNTFHLSLCLTNVIFISGMKLDQSLLKCYALFLFELLLDMLATHQAKSLRMTVIIILLY